jgi:putative endonuclease
VYILANRRQGTLYTGVTSILAERIFRHREGLTPGLYSPLKLLALADAIT